MPGRTTLVNRARFSPHTRLLIVQRETPTGSSPATARSTPHKAGRGFEVVVAVVRCLYRSIVESVAGGQCSQHPGGEHEHRAGGPSDAAGVVGEQQAGDAEHGGGDDDARWACSTAKCSTCG